MLGSEMPLDDFWCWEEFIGEQGVQDKWCLGVLVLEKGEERRCRKEWVVV